MSRYLYGFFILLTLLFQISPFSFAEEAKAQEPKDAGEFFGMSVPRENYYFAARVILNFNTPWGGIPGNTEEFEKRVWDELLLSYEAFRRDIEPTRQEVEEEISNTIRGGKGPSNWKDDKKAYAKWAKKNLRESSRVFENQMKHLVQLKKLRQQVFDSINPDVTDEEAFQEFLNEYNTLSVELVQFDKLEEAEAFYKKSKSNPKFWEQKSEEDKKKDKADKSFRYPGFVSLEFLIDMWKFPKDDVYKMMEMEAGAIYPPAPIYKGYGVFKILETRQADKEAYPKQKESYYGQIRMKKKYEGFYKWLEDLRNRANIKIYIKPPEQMFNK